MGDTKPFFAEYTFIPPLVPSICPELVFILYNFKSYLS